MNTKQKKKKQKDNTLNKSTSIKKMNHVKVKASNGKYYY